VDEAGLERAGALVVVARVLVKERGEHRMSEEITGASVDKLCSKTFAVSRGALSVSGIGVMRLLEASREANSDHGNRIEGASCSEREFLFRSERGGVINVACIEVWDDADQTLLLFRFYLFSGDQVGWTDRDLYACDRN
jgi:hypothetical protein